MSFTGLEAVWIIKTSALRTDASMDTQFSPLENRVLRRAVRPTGYPILFNSALKLGFSCIQSGLRVTLS